MKSVGSTERIRPRWEAMASMEVLKKKPEPEGYEGRGWESKRM